MALQAALTADVLSRTVRVPPSRAPCSASELHKRPCQEELETQKVLLAGTDGAASGCRWLASTAAPTVPQLTEGSALFELTELLLEEPPGGLMFRVLLPSEFQAWNHPAALLGSLMFLHQHPSTLLHPPDALKSVQTLIKASGGF